MLRDENAAMCNRVVQNDLILKPGGKITVLMKGPGGEFELPFNEAIFGGPAKKESRNYWLQREGAVDVIVPNVTRFGEEQNDGGTRLGGCAARHGAGGIAAAATARERLSPPEDRHPARHARSACPPRQRPRSHCEVEGGALRMVGNRKGSGSNDNRSKRKLGTEDITTGARQQFEESRSLLSFSAKVLPVRETSGYPQLRIQSRPFQNQP